MTALMDRSILYVSRQTLVSLDPEKAVFDIVTTARRRNAEAGITGAMAYTNGYFAQVIEGTGVALDELMHRIESDDRHSEVTVLRCDAITRRLLPHWSMAYAGRSTYIARQISPLIGDVANASSGRIDRLLNLLVGLASTESQR